MISGRIACELAVTAVLCVLVIFFFPSVQGPYSAVHGPATALQAVRAATRTKATIVQGALASLGNARVSPFAVLSRISRSEPSPYRTNFLKLDSILRC
jgi:hypothetical protein